MKYVRVFECAGLGNCEYITTYREHCEHVVGLQEGGFEFEGCIVKGADTIEDLIQVGDLVFVLYSSDGYKQECPILIKDELTREMIINSGVITKLFIPDEDNYKCVAKATHAFKTLSGLRCLIAKGELELL